MTSTQSLTERLQRAESWLTAASALAPSLNQESFIFLSIALNSLLGRRRYEGDKAHVREDIDEFMKKVMVMHKNDEEHGGTFLRKAVTACRKDGAVLIRDRFLKDAYWRRSVPSPELQQRLVRESLHATARILEGDYRTFLSLVLNRMVVLRNQLMHGCATYGPRSLGRSSLQCGTRFLKIMVPAFYELASNYGQAVRWDPVPYPRLGSHEPSYQRAQIHSLPGQEPARLSTLTPE